VAPEAAAQPDLLVGQWLLTQTDGGFSGKTIPADPAHPQEIIFTANHQVTFLLNGAVSNSTTYSLAQASSYLTRQPQTFLVYGARTGAEKQFINDLSASRLVIKEDYADGRSYYYTRH
jgi:hypothetical protein